MIRTVLSRRCRICNLPILFSRREVCLLCGKGYHRKCYAGWFSSLEEEEKKAPACPSCVGRIGLSVVFPQEEMEAPSG